MDSINSIFKQNSFATYPIKTSSNKRKIYTDILEKKPKNENEITPYLDILYSEKDENFFINTEKLNIISAHLPMRSQTLKLGNFFC